jgi:hypothetical protein
MEINSMLQSVNAVILVTIKGTEKNFKTIASRIQKSMQKSIITAHSYNANFETIAESFRDVIGCFNFLAFQIPVIVSIRIKNPTRNKMPDIGIKNAVIMLIKVNKFVWMLNNKIANCAFILQSFVQLK